MFTAKIYNSLIKEPKQMEEENYNKIAQKYQDGSCKTLSIIMLTGNRLNFLIESPMQWLNG